MMESKINLLEKVRARLGVKADGYIGQEKGMELNRGKCFIA